jgi:hypothetical protein
MPLCAALAAGCVLELLARVHSHKYVCSRLRTPNLLAGMCRGGTCMLAGVCACVIGPRALRGRRSRLTALLQMVQHRRAGECNVLVGHAGRRLQYACRHACMWWVQYACYHAGWRLQYAEWSCLLWWVLHYAGAEPQTAWPVLVRGCVRCGRLAACMLPGTLPQYAVLACALCLPGCCASLRPLCLAPYACRCYSQIWFTPAPCAQPPWIAAAAMYGGAALCGVPGCSWGPCPVSIA